MFGFFKKKKAPEQVSEVPYILAIADCISHNNSTVHDSLERCRNDRAAYAAQFAERFAERGIDAASCDMDTLCWIAMADELEAAHALIGVDSSSAPCHFLLKRFIVRSGPIAANERIASPKYLSRSGIALRSSSFQCPST